MLIAIDGPAGAGKSTVAKSLARRLGFYYADTGSIYRGFTYAVLEKGVDAKDRPRVIELARGLRLDLISLPRGNSQVLLEGCDISDKLRLPEVDRWAPIVSAIPEVRDLLREQQTRLALLGDLVVEGRDTTTRVFPKADFKVYLDASFEERVRRRFEEQRERGLSLSVDQTFKHMRERDSIDKGRAADPLQKAEDAAFIDTTNLAAEAVVLEILKAMRLRRTKNAFVYSILHKPVVPLVKLLFRLKGIGQENLPALGGVIIASNHRSYVDPPCVGYASRRQLSYLARDSLFRVPFLGWLLRAVNSYPIRRGTADRQALATAIRLVLEGNAVVLFPEGTRSRTGKLGPGKSGIGYIALRSAAPVIPAFVQGTSEVLPRGSGWIRFRPIQVTFGKPVPLDDLLLGLPDQKALYEEATARIMAAIEALSRQEKPS